MFRYTYTLALAGLVFAQFIYAGDAVAKENLLVGKRLFNSYCSLCHGEDGQGKGVLTAKLKLEKPPANLTDDKYQSQNVEDLLRLIQGYNRDNSTMPDWEQVIPERNLRNVAAYVLALTQTDMRIRGDARRGREIFRQSCVACHGYKGTGNGVLAKILKVKMINYGSKSITQISDKEIIKTITEGKGEFMPPWKSTLSSEEIKDVASYIRSLFKP